MAEESANPPVTPEKNEFDSTKMDKNSAENPPSPSKQFVSHGASNNSHHTGDISRRYSSGEKPDISLRRVPIHLRASTGSCHDICKYGKKHAFEEKTRVPFRKRASKSSTNEPNFLKVIVSDNKQQEESIEEKEVEPLQTRTSKSSPNELKPVKTKQNSVSPLAKSFSPKLEASLRTSPRRSALLGNKTRLPSLSPAKRSSTLELPENIETEILVPCEKVEVLSKEGSSNGNKVSRVNKKTCDESVKCSSPVQLKLIKVKPSIASSGDSYGVLGKGRRNSDGQIGRKMTSSMMSAKNASETLAARVSPKFSLAKTAASKAREAERVKSSLSSPLKYRKSNGVVKTKMEKNELNPKARKAERVKSPCSPNRQEGVHGVEPEKSNGEDSEKRLHVIKTEAESKALPSSSSSVSSRANSPSSSSHEEKEDEDIQSSGNEADTFVSEKNVSIEIGNTRPVEENHTLAKSSSSSSCENNYETINDSKNEADELIGDKIESSEIENLQQLDENHSSHEEDDEEIYPSSSDSSTHARTSSLSSLEEIDEEIDGDARESVSDKMTSMEIGEAPSPKENRSALKKSRSVRSDNKNCSPVKLKFRRGKIIDLQPENNVPKRLNFRRSRIGGNKTDDFGNVKPATPNKTLRKAVSSISSNKRSTEIGDAKPGTPNKALRKSRSAVSEDKYRSRANLARREKTVDLNTASNSPTRLKYTRDRVPRAEDAKNDVRRKNIKKTGGKSDGVGFDLSSRQVTLKHPEVQSKKNGQVLLNNVIEETASKLVESRKSKVKALVGAFETVISLHEPKSSSH